MSQWVVGVTSSPSSPRSLWFWVSLGMLILAGLVLGAWPMSAQIRPSARAVAPGPVAMRDDEGLQLALALPRGPYFQNELLPITLTLTNRSDRSIPYDGTSVYAICRDPALSVTATRNGQYLAPVAIGFMPSCPAIRPVSHALRPSKSLRMRALIGIPSAGPLRLTARATFPQNAHVTSPGLLAPDRHLDALRHLIPALFQSSHAPFTSGWPSLTIRVVRAIPANRMLHLARQGHTVYLRNPPRGLPSPVARQQTVAATGQGACATGLALWTPLSAGIVRDPSCGGPSEKWQVLVSAPGYAIAQGVYCFNPARNMVFGGIPGNPHGWGPPCTERIVESPTPSGV